MVARRKTQRARVLTMVCQPRAWLKAGLTLVALCAAWPGVAQAGWIGFYNEAGYPVVVQFSVVVNNVEQRGTPNRLNARETYWEQVGQPGSRMVTIFDGKQTT